MALPSMPMSTWRSLDDAADQLNLSRRTITRWIGEGKIKAYRIAGERKHFVDLDEIEKLREPKPIPRPKKKG